MYLFYLDDSGDPETNHYVFSAIGVPEQNWREVFDRIKSFRELLREKRGIHPSKELHATKFLSGRGRPSDTRHLSREQRADIFNRALQMLASFEPLGVRIINAALHNQVWAYERVINRINMCAKKTNQKALIISDEGNEGDYIRLCRKLRAHNPMPSKYRVWGDGSPWKNMPATDIVEDPIFKDSRSSNFIQLADFCAFALLRMDKPTPVLRQLGIHESFRLLRPVCHKEGSPADEFGVSR